MHTHKCNGGTAFIHNSDLSGSVRIINNEGVALSVPGSDLIEFIGSYVIKERVSRLESMSPHEMLGLDAKT